MADPPVRRLTLYSRAECSLCASMLREIEVARARLNFALEVRDIDADPRLAARWNDAVPVLCDGDFEILRYYYDGDRLAAYFSRR